MKIVHRWEPDNVFEMVFVPGTHGHSYPFGEGASGPDVGIQDFFIGIVPVTQALWRHVMDPDANAAANRGPDLPVENVSWDQITRPGGFLDRINQSVVSPSILSQLPSGAGRFRLPSETEWELRGSRWTSLARWFSLQRQ
jgi:formylglycine-generating enzyme required for sulfatase activity